MATTEDRRQARIDEASTGLLTAMRLLEHFNATVRQDGITIDNCGGVDLNAVRQRIAAGAERLRLAEVYGELDADDLADLGGGD